MNSKKDLDQIEAGLMQLHKAGLQHKDWEQIVQEAGVELDRPAAALLRVLQLYAKPCRMLDLAQYLGVEAPSVSRKVQELETAGMLVRKADSRDGRVSNVSLTAKGRGQLKRLQRIRRSYLAQALKSWDSQDRHQLATLMTRLTNDLIAAKQQRQHT